MWFLLFCYRVFRNVICNNSNVEITQVIWLIWVREQRHIHISVIYWSIRNKWNMDAPHVSEHKKMLWKEKKIGHKGPHVVWVHLYEPLRSSKSRKQSILDDCLGLMLVSGGMGEWPLMYMEFLYGLLTYFKLLVVVAIKFYEDSKNHWIKYWSISFSELNVHKTEANKLLWGS